MEFISRALRGPQTRCSLAKNREIEKYGGQGE